MIVYCYYPSAKLLIENDDVDYLTYHLNTDRLRSHFISNAEVSSQIAYKNPNQLMFQIVESTGTEYRMNEHSDNRNEYVLWVKKTYDSMINNSFSITNFSS